MALTEPGKIITPWANAGLKNAIPDSANPVSGAAGYDLGFPPVTMTPPEAGGIPPQGQDFNGILNAVTTILRYFQAGGLPGFDAALATTIGGYTKGAIVIGTDGTTLWQNKLDGNTEDPNSGGANWVDAVLKILPKLAFSANDYIRIPDVAGGLIIQWGQMTQSVGSGTVTFPIAFPNSVMQVFVSGFSDAPVIATYQFPGTTGVFINTWNPNGTPTTVTITTSWFAIGY